MSATIHRKQAKQLTGRTLFHQFCRMMVDKYKNPNRISVEIFAGEFINFFHLPEYPCLEDIKELCSSACVLAESRELPSASTGLYSAYEGKFLIYYADSSWEGLQLISLLHEVRELMCVIFTEVNPDITKPTKLESLSEAFASAVAMKKPTFIKDVMKSFFNPISLQRKYGLSYHHILFRMIRVFDKAIPMSVSLFQNAKLLALSQTTSSWREYINKVKQIQEAEDPESFVLTLSSQTSRFNSRDCVHLYHGFLPKKNDSIISCQHALNVLEYGEHVLDQRYRLPGSVEYQQIRQAELISDGFISTHNGVPANIILVSIPECFRRKYDPKWINPKCDPLMGNVDTLGEVFGSMAGKAKSRCVASKLSF